MGRTDSLLSDCALVEDEFNPLNDDFQTKKRTYMHFDLPLSESERSSQNFTDSQLETHSFWPLLGFSIIERRVKNGATRNEVTFFKKSREIKFGAHKDAAILEWYSSRLSRDYERFLSGKKYEGSVLAYRSGVGNNIDHADSLFQEIRNRGNCTCIAMDISGFFDNIDHSRLKSSLQNVLGADRLSTPSFRVFSRMTKFDYVDSDRLKEALGKEYGKRGRICSAEVFRNEVRGGSENLIQKNTNDYGIPQGTPVSGLYANISLIEFDRVIQLYAQRRGGSYRRYSDDIVLVLPLTVDANLAERHVRRLLKKENLSVKDSKTEVSIFSQDGSDILSDRPFQYLGFTFDGQKILIRSSSLNRYHRKMRKGVRAKIRAAYNKKIPRDEIYMRELYKKYTHLGRHRNFPRYAYRAADKMNAPEIRAQLADHVRKFKSLVRKQIDAVYGVVP